MCIFELLNNAILGGAIFFNSNLQSKIIAELNVYTCCIQVMEFQFFWQGIYILSKSDKENTQNKTANFHLTIEKGSYCTRIYKYSEWWGEDKAKFSLLLAAFQWLFEESSIGNIPRGAEEGRRQQLVRLRRAGNYGLRAPTDVPLMRLTDESAANETSKVWLAPLMAMGNGRSGTMVDIVTNLSRWCHIISQRPSQLSWQQLNEL